MPATDNLCFVMMPFSAAKNSGYEPDHWTEVYEDLFVPAICDAGFDPARADTTELSRHILSDLLMTIERAAVIICDLSTANPNVLFELGWAFRADRPCVLVMDDRTRYPFDLQHSYVMQYHSSLKSRLVTSDQKQLSTLITNTINDEECRWSMVQSLGLNAELRLHAAKDGDPIARAIIEIQRELAAIRVHLDGSSTSLGPSTVFNNFASAEDSQVKGTQIPKNRILEVLEDERGVVGETAKRLGISPKRLYRLLKHHNIQARQFR
jgi:hypothetical protein